VELGIVKYNFAQKRRIDIDLSLVPEEIGSIKRDF
jgi:hypothetical protein